MTDLIRLAEALKKASQHKNDSVFEFAPDDNYILATAVLPILKALEEESKKPCSFDSKMDCLKSGVFLKNFCPSCWSRHLIGGE
jgi:hypothetical protein